MVKEQTKKTQIVHALRLLWLRSRERAVALKRDGYRCQECGVKQSKAKGHVQRVEVHHRAGSCNWDRIVAVIHEELLCDPCELEVLCPRCHKRRKI